MGLKLIFLIVTRAVSLLGLSRREWWWRDAEILVLRHQLAVAERERPRAHSRLTWPDRAWLAPRHLEGMDHTGDVHEDRGLKGRSRKSVRKVPIPPELVLALELAILI